MKIRWAPEAAEDYSHIVHYIREDNASAALRVAKSIRESIATLKTFPRLGRPGRMEGTRELVLPPLPFIGSTGLKTRLLKSPEYCTGHSAGRSRRADQVRLYFFF